MSAPRTILCPACGRSFAEGERFCSFDRSPLPAPPPIAADALLNATIDGRYTILERLGAGGMGVVYKALQHRLNRPVALKILAPRFGDDPTAADRFRIEALASSQLTNGHTVSVYDFGSMEDGSLFIAMQLLEGESLRTRLKRGPLPPRAAVTIAMHVCESLAEAHERPTPIFHRDIKPDNIFVRDTSHGQVHATVLDFGLARFADSQRMRLTSANIALGTPAYMSPEQCRGNLPVDGRSDLYSVGIALYEMLTGKPPFESADPPALLFKHVYEAPPMLSSAQVPQPLDQLTMSLLAKAPADRPKSAQVAGERLREILDLLPRLEPLPADSGNRITIPARRLSEEALPPAPTTGVELTGFAPRADDSELIALQRLRGIRRRQITIALVAVATIAGLAVIIHARPRAPAPVPLVAPLPLPSLPVAAPVDAPPAPTIHAAAAPPAPPKAATATPLKAPRVKHTAQAEDWKKALKL